MMISKGVAMGTQARGKAAPHVRVALLRACVEAAVALHMPSTLIAPRWAAHP